MALQLPAPFRPDVQGPNWEPVKSIDKPTWGPPDMAQQLQSGIAGIGTAFEGAYERARGRGAQDQLAEYYRTHPFAQQPGGTGSPIAGGGPGGGGGTAPIANNPFKTQNPTATGLKPYEAGILNGIAGPESNGAYNVRFGGTGNKPQTFDSFDRHPGIFEPGPAGPSSAAGRYQFTKTTWDKLMGADTPFTPENQDVAALRLARQDYNGRTGRDLDADVQTEGFSPRIQAVLKPTWAGLGGGNTGRVSSTYGQTIGSYKTDDRPSVQLSSRPQAPEGVAPGAMAAAGSARPTQDLSVIPDIDPAGYAGANPQLVSVAALAQRRNPGLFALNPESKTIRSEAEQREMVDKGFSKTMNSYHRTGNALDVVPINPETGQPDANYQAGYAKINEEMKKAAKDLGVKNVAWGGDWKTFVDKPHWQITGTDYRYDPNAATAAAASGRRADVPAGGAQPAGLRMPPGQEGFFQVPGSGEQIPVGQGADRANRGVVTQPVQVADPNAAPLPPQRPPGTGGTGGPPPAGAPPGSVAAAAPTTTPAQQPAPSRSQQPLFANAPAPGAVPTQGGDSVYAATAAYNQGVASGQLPAPTQPMPGAAPPGPAGGGPATTGSLPAPGARVPSAAPVAAPAAAPTAARPNAAAAAAIPPWSGGQMVEEIAQELHRSKGMPLEEARVRAAGATWDEKGFRLGPGPGEKGAAKVPPHDPSGAGGLYVPGAPPPAGAGGAAQGPAGAGGAAPAGAPAPVGAAAPPQGGRVFQPHEALAIAARGDPAVFNAMLREYGPNGSGNKGYGFTEVGGVLYRTNPVTGEATPIGGSATGKNTQTVTADGRAYERQPDGTWKEITPSGAPGAPTKEQAAGEAGLRKEFEEKIKDYRTVKTAMDRIESAKDDPTGGGDMAVMYSWLKILDPDTGIREGEYATVQNSGSLDQKWTGIWNEVVSGKKLDDNVRADIINRARGLTASRSAQAEKDAKFYQGQATRYRYDPAAVTGSYEPYKRPESGPATPAKAGALPGVSGTGTKDAPYRVPANADFSAAAAWVRGLPDGTHYVSPDGKPHLTGPGGY